MGPATERCSRANQHREAPPRCGRALKTRRTRRGSSGSGARGRNPPGLHRSWRCSRQREVGPVRRRYRLAPAGVPYRPLECAARDRPCDFEQIRPSAGSRELHHLQELLVIGPILGLDSPGGPRIRGCTRFPRRAAGGGRRAAAGGGGLLRGFLSACGPRGFHPLGHRLLLFGRHRTALPRRCGVGRGLRDRGGRSRRPPRGGAPSRWLRRSGGPEDLVDVVQRLDFRLQALDLTLPGGDCLCYNTHGFFSGAVSSTARRARRGRARPWVRILAQRGLAGQTEPVPLRLWRQRCWPASGPGSCGGRTARPPLPATPGYATRATWSNGQRWCVGSREDLADPPRPSERSRADRASPLRGVASPRSRY